MMFITVLMWFAACASASRIIHRQQDGKATLPVEPTAFEDIPTVSNDITYSSYHPSSADDDDAGASSDPTFFVQTTFPSVTGTDFITLSGTNTESVSDEDDEERSSATVTEAATTTAVSTSETAGAEDAETTTDSDDAAPTARPAEAVAGIAALLGLAAVI